MAPATSLARAPSLLLADEPFGALHALTRIKMHGLLRRLVSIHRPAVMLVTHDVDEALVLADRVLVIEDGRIGLDVAVPLSHPRRKPDPEFDRLRSELRASLSVTAEAGLFDSIFIADALAIGGQMEFVAKGGLEPLTLLAALSRATTHIGLIATASTTYYEPFNLARLFSSLDHISKGRVGWNIVTSWVQGAAENFGYAQMPDHAERYARAHEFLEVAIKLWDSWADDAILDDTDGGRYVRPGRIRRIDHVGKHHRVAGPLNISRSPQGRPVLIQAGSSDTGKEFAAKYAEAIFTAHLDKESAVRFYQDVKRRASDFGRDAGQMLILPGISPVIGSTEREALRILEELDDLTAPEAGLAHLSNRFGGHDFSHLDLDHPLSPDDFPDPATVQAAQSRATVIT